jgi:uncharacterized protein (DUF1778 family)
MVIFCSIPPAATPVEKYGEMPYARPAREVSMASSTDRQSSADRELKRERIELRVAPSAKLVIQRAMAVSGLTAGDLAYEGARRVLDEHERMVLVGADREAFLAAVMEPPEPAEKLVSALRRLQDLKG